MAYGIPKLRQLSLMGGYDQLTPGMGMEYEDEFGYDSMPTYEAPSMPTYSPESTRTFSDSVMNPQMPSRPSSGTAGVASALDPDAASRQMMDAINRIYTPETVDRDRLRGLMDSFPERESPSFLRSLVAGGMSLKAQDPVATANAVMEAPHRRNMQDWTARVDPFVKTADLENRANVNERTLAGNVVNATTQASRIASQERIAEEKNEIARIRAQAYDYAQRLGKGWEFDVSGTTVLAKNKTNGEIIDTGLETGKMDERTKIELQNKGRVDAARETGMFAGARAAMTGPVYQTSDGKQYRMGPDGTLVPAEGSPGPLTRVGSPNKTDTTTPAESKQAYQEKLRPVYQMHPEFFTNRNGVLELKPRPKQGRVFNNDEEIAKWDEVKRQIDPSYVPPATSSKSTNPGSTSIPSSKPSTSSYSPSKYPTPNFGGDSKGLGPSNTPSPNQPPAQQRAIEFLKKNGLPVTEANISHAIRTGRVK